MRKSVIISLMLLCFTSASAQSIEKRLVSFSTEQGEAYFISDKKLGNHSQGIKQFVYDLTYVSHNDSVTMNFTVVSPNRGDISQLSMSSGDFKTVASGVQLLYHEPKGKQYVVRTTAKVSYNDIKRLYTSDIPVVINFTDDRGNSNFATYSLSDWRKEKALFDKIFYVINI